VDVVGTVPAAAQHRVRALVAHAAVDVVLLLRLLLAALSSPPKNGL